ncbi:hypothetical protein GW17_00056644 [Ensete ventricosum]|nr:hypothetical protein GW17_00056644 [Ensete ventricosum]
MASEKSKILIIGGTGYIGKFIVFASARLGNPTFALVRSTTAPADQPEKAKLLSDFQAAGVTLVQVKLMPPSSSSPSGSPSLIRAPFKLNVWVMGEFLQRYLPSEFGNDVDRSNAVEPAKSTFVVKQQIRRAIEASGIPYTFVSSNFFGGYFLPVLGQAGATGPPTDKVVILVDDPRTLNKVVYLRPPANILSHNELISLWEKKVGKTFERVYVPEEEVLKQIQGA